MEERNESKRMKLFKDPILILFITIVAINVIMSNTMLNYSNFQVQRTAEIESKLINVEYTVEHTMKEFIYVHEQIDLWSGNQTKRKRVNGVYWKDNDYYCVWVKEREPLNIARTEQHEYCHSLIDLDNESHFCYNEKE